jgi:hypothetical protein
LNTLESGPAVRAWETRGLRMPARPVLASTLAMAGLLLFYVGIITLAQGWAHARQQLWEDRGFVGTIVLGFGMQMGLFVYLRGLHRGIHAHGVMASTGTSAAAMLACCAHHLTEVLPLIGLSGAAIFLNAYKTPFLWLGILMNGVGLLYLLCQIREQRQVRCDPTEESSSKHATNAG